MKLTQQEQVRRVLIDGPAFPDEVSAATGVPLRQASAVLDTLCKAGRVVRSSARVPRPGGNSAYLYALRHREWRWWTVHDLKRLRQLVEQGLSAKDIARELGRTVVAIRNQVLRMGLTLNTRKQQVWSPEMKMRAAILRDSGMTHEEVSIQLGVPLGTVQNWNRLRSAHTPDTLAASPAKVD